MPEQDSENSADQAQHHRLDQELLQNILRTRADRHAQSDLPCPLGHRNEHDVHDSDSADDQRNQRHTEQQIGHDRGRSGQHLHELRGVADTEIVLLIGFEAVAFAEQSGHGIHRVIDLLGRDRGQQDLIDMDELRDQQRIVLHGFDGLGIERDALGRIEVGRRCRRRACGIRRGSGFESGQTQAGRCPWQDNHIVLIHSHHVCALALEHADDFECGVDDPDFVVDRGDPAEELADDGCADQTDSGTVVHLPLRERTPFPDHPVPDLQEIRRRSLDPVRSIVGVSVDHLQTVGVHDGNRHGDSGTLPVDRLAVLRRQRHLSSGSL